MCVSKQHFLNNFTHQELRQSERMGTVVALVQAERPTPDPERWPPV